MSENEKKELSEQELNEISGGLANEFIRRYIFRCPNCKATQTITGDYGKAPFAAAAQRWSTGTQPRS